MRIVLRMMYKEELMGFKWWVFEESVKDLEMGFWEMDGVGKK